MLHNWENHGTVTATKHDFNLPEDERTVKWVCNNCKASWYSPKKSKPSRRRAKLYGTPFASSDGLYSCEDIIVGSVQEE
jgi:hypothetical protein